jgi:hypothetical protein
MCFLVFTFVPIEFSLSNCSGRLVLLLMNSSMVYHPSMPIRPEGILENILLARVEWREDMFSVGGHQLYEEFTDTRFTNDLDAEVQRKSKLTCSLQALIGIKSPQSLVHSNETVYLSRLRLPPLPRPALIISNMFDRNFDPHPSPPAAHRARI